MANKNENQRQPDTDTALTISNKVKSKMTTIADQLREEGIKEGREEGIKEGIKLVKLEIAKQLLTEKSDLSDSELIPMIQRITDLSIEQIKELQADIE